MKWKILIIVVLAAGLVAVALRLGRLTFSEPAGQTEVTNDGGTNQAKRKRVRPPRDPNQAGNADDLANASQTNQFSNWETYVDDILASTNEPAEQGRRLFALFGSFPPEGQVETAQHIANLLSDDDYQPFGLQLADTNTLAEVQEVILADVLNRPNKVKLPLLLEVAKSPGHPKADEAKELLELFLENNYREDWQMWSDKITLWLQQNPDTP